MLPVIDVYLDGPLTSGHGASGSYGISFYSLLFSLFILVSSRYAADQWLDFYPLFILATILFNLSFQGLYALGLASLEYDFLGRGVNYQIFKSATAYTLFLVGFFHAGALITFTPEVKKLKNIKISRTLYLEQRNQGKVLLMAGLIFLLIASPGVITYFYSALKVVRSGGYNAFMSRELYGLSSWSSIVSGFLVPAIFFLLLAGKTRKSSRVLSLLCMISFSVIYLAIGRRAFPAMMLLSYIVIVDLYIKRIPRKWVGLGALTSLIVFPIIASLRNLGSTFNSSLHDLANFELLRLPVNAIQEMGRSFRVMYWSTELLMGDGGYLFGSTYFWAFTKIMPNIFWAHHPSTDTGVGDLLTAQFMPSIAAKGGAMGLGSSFLAEAYLNFGLILGAFTCFIFGVGLQKFVQWAKKGSIARVFWLGAFFSSAFILARGESQSVMRDIFWFSLFPYLFFVFFWQYLSPKNRR